MQKITDRAGYWACVHSNFVPYHTAGGVIRMSEENNQQSNGSLGNPVQNQQQQPYYYSNQPYQPTGQQPPQRFGQQPPQRFGQQPPQQYRQRPYGQPQHGQHPPYGQHPPQYAGGNVHYCSQQQVHPAMTNKSKPINQKFSPSPTLDKWIY